MVFKPVAMTTSLFAWCGWHLPFKMGIRPADYTLTAGLGTLPRTQTASSMERMTHRRRDFRWVKAQAPG